MTKMAAGEFFLQDGGVSESFTHKMAAWEFCLQRPAQGTSTVSVVSAHLISFPVDCLFFKRIKRSIHHHHHLFAQIN